MASTPKPHLAALVGRRVSLRNGWDNYPTVMVPAGTTGTVESYDPDIGLYVALDVHVPELDEWHNRLELYDWDDAEHPLIDELDIIAEYRESDLDGPDEQRAWYDTSEELK